MTMMSRVRVGFLGAGGHNSFHHYPSIASSPDAVFYAVCELNRELMEQRAGPYKPEVMTTDYDCLLADSKVDIVWIAAHPTQQAELTRRALKAGKNTFVEKPMAETMNECVELGRLAKEKGARLFNGYNRRFAPAYVDLKSILGKMKRPPMLTYRLADDSSGRGAEAFKRPQLLDETCHVFDILAYLTGSEPVEICVFSASMNSDMVLIQYENNSVATIISSLQSTMAWPKERIEVLMDNAAASVEDFVELQVANVPGWGCMTKRYQGNEYPGWLSGYKERMEWEGLDAVLAFRRRWLEIITEAGVPTWEHTPENYKKRDALVEAHKAKMPPVNYMVNKGWRNADHAILKAVREKKPTQAAGAKDAARSIACAEAAIRSAKIHAVVKLDPKTWEV